jgi:hypothetical protein
MVWIKRNLLFVICIVIGLLLTGYCGWLFYSAMGANSGLSDEFNTTLESLRTIEQKSPFPSTENIQAAKADQERMRLFLADFRKRFAPFPKPPKEDQKGFKTYLEESMVRFRDSATNAGVQLPVDYAFAFSGLMGKLAYPPDNIQPWMEQLVEVGAILDILYRAKINYLGPLQRVPVAADDIGTTDCLPATSVTNQWGVVTPYKITFRGFSTEVAAVLDGFARSSNCFIIKAINVAPDKSVQMAPQQQPASVYYQQPQYPNLAFSRQEHYRDIPGAYRPQVPIAVAPVLSAPSGPVTVLSENPLLVTFSVDVVKLKASEN